MNIIAQLKTASQIPLPPTGYGTLFVDVADNAPKIKLQDGTISTLRGLSASVAVGTVTALAAGTTPTVTNAGSATQAIFNFGIPGTPVLTLGTVSKSGLGGAAEATNSGTALAPVWNFTLPVGSKTTVGPFIMTEPYRELTITDASVSASNVPCSIIITGDRFTDLSYATKVISVSAGSWVCGVTAFDPDGNDLSNIPLPLISLTYLV